MSFHKVIGKHHEHFTFFIQRAENASTVQSFVRENFINLVEMSDEPPVRILLRYSYVWVFCKWCSIPKKNYISIYLFCPLNFGVRDKGKREFASKNSLAC